jgi:peptide-methionine (S)-S-oxide reductase
LACCFTHFDEQALAARARIAELSASGSYRQPVVTQVIPATNFWKAEEYTSAIWKNAAW